MFRNLAGLFLIVSYSALLALGSVFGSVRSLVHDPQHRPVANAEIVLQSRTSAVRFSARTDAQGVAQFLSVPIGDYQLEIHASGFAPRTDAVTVLSDRLQEVHAVLELATAKTQVDVTAPPVNLIPSSSATQSSITRAEISRTPGADRTNSLAFVTDYVPGAYVVHDQLHVRGGHQVTWAIDGVPVPNTNIADTVGPQFDPKDVDFVEAQRGGLLADYGDRTYGVFNVSPKSGFDRQRTAELQLSYGNYNETDDQLSFADHTERFAYYVSANGNRTDHGLETPTFSNLHNQAAGGGGFTSLTYNAASGDQWRLVGSGRADYFQVPNDPVQQAAGLRDHDSEKDAFLTGTYLHPLGTAAVLTVSPFFHYNRAALEPSTTDDRSSTYYGGQAALAYAKGRHNAKIGIYAFGQHDNTLFQLDANHLRQTEHGQLQALFLEDQFKAANWLTLNAGIRLTRFSGLVDETAASPRGGIALRIPGVHWIVRGSYGRFYQAPPLSTVSNDLLGEDEGFLPLRGERDEQYDVGLTVPLHGWTLDSDLFRTNARNFFDHDALSNSNIFLPLTIDRVRIQGAEATLRSPRMFHHASVHATYSHQIVRGQGGVTGGLTNFEPPPDGFFYLDHDQRNTFATGADADLPWRTWISASMTYGSGFLNGDGPSHLPGNHTESLAIGKEFGENWSLKFTATNIADSRYFIDFSNTFGGSHLAEPRKISMQVRYRFHY